MSFEYAKAGCSKEELEKYRNKSGFIDLDMLDISFTDESRERMGNPNREKNWIDFNGRKALFKQEVRLDDRENAMIYAELIVEELAKQVGIEVAETDIVIKNGKKGVLSYSVLKEDEELHSINSLIGQPKEYEDFPEIVDLYDVIFNTAEILNKEHVGKGNTKKIAADIEKILVFDTFTLATDRHTENLSLIFDKQGNFKLSPIYDNENALMLDMDMDLLQSLSEAPGRVKDCCDFIDPKIALIPECDIGNMCLWEDTLIEMCEAKVILNFAHECYDKLNITQAIESVEEKIQAEIPLSVKNVTKTAFDYRKEKVREIIEREFGGYEEQEKKQIDIN